MKKRIIASITVAVLLIGALFAVGLSTDDPLITESYLNEVFFKKVKEYIKENTNTTAPSVAEASVFELVTVDAGKQFVAKSGCEFIVRQGSAKVVISSLGGVSDVTDGIDIVSGELPANHHFIVARDDGRGFKAENQVLVLVKGGYEIK